MTLSPPPSWQPLFSAVPEWAGLGALLDARFNAGHHGDYPRWQQALDALPALDVNDYSLGPTVTIDGPIGPADRARLEASLRRLQPWRKGPFSLFGIEIDTEWRSDWKWRRLAPHLPDLTQARVLDVGCGNGYFGWRALEAGAALVAGVDPMLLFTMQHRAINRYLRCQRNWLVPLAFEEMPIAQFDTVLSMGVIYHRRDPAEHARRLAAFTRAGGRVVLESLIVNDPAGLAPQGRYARMRNLWLLPSVAQMIGWLADAGFDELEVVDVTPTDPAEQRTTAWMPYESLAQALDPADASKTIEGHPAPVRAIVVGRKPTG